MIRYELKDKERQAALEKALPGFGEALQATCEGEYNDGFCYINVVISNHETWAIGGHLSLKKEAICVKHVYDPKAWNDYPEVMPPEGTLMRIEGHYQTHRDAHYAGAAIWGNGTWYPTATASKDVVVERFRPWDEKWEDEE